MTPETAQRVACPVCGGRDSIAWALATDVEYRTSDEQYAYRRCQCGVIYIDPVPADRLSEIYPSTYYAYATGKPGVVERVKQRLDERRFRRLLEGISANRLHVLDVGGGDGWLLSVLRNIDPRITTTQVVDLDPNAAALAKERGHQYWCGRIEDFASEERFELVLLLNIIEHVADPAAVLTRIAGLLAPGGVVLVKTPNTASVDARLFRHRDWGGYHCPRHWVLFDRPTIEALAERCGLRVVRFSYTQGAPFWTVGVLAALARRRLVSVSTARPMVRHRLFAPLSAAFAAVDLARASLGGRTSQMFLELTAAGGGES